MSRFPWVVGVLLIGALTAGGAERPATNQASSSRQDLEKQSASAPDDRDLHARLLELYFLDRSPEGRAARASHVLWVIAHAPEMDVAGTPFAGFIRFTEPEAYDRGRALWLGHVEADGTNPTILAHAARFFTIDDRNRAEEPLQRAARLEPDNPEWQRQLGHLQTLKAPAGAPDPKTAHAALGHYEAAFSETKGDTKRYHALADLAESALGAGEAEKAREYAFELLESAVALPRDWNYGNAIHDGHRILGHLALLQGDAAGAKDHLLAAGATPGSPQLDSFGPELTLANALLEAGERAAVVEYLTLCQRFWKHRDTAIGEWIAEIQAGKTPDLNRFRARADQP